MHAWSADSAQAILWSPHVIFELAPTTMDQSDLSHFLLVSWANHPDLIPNEVRCIIPEPLEPFVKHYPPLFLRASGNTFQKRYSPVPCVHPHSGAARLLPPSEHPSGNPDRGLSHTWPQVLVNDSNPTCGRWSSLPRGGGSASWCSLKHPQQPPRSTRAHQGTCLPMPEIGAQHRQWLTSRAAIQVQDQPAVRVAIQKCHG
jgi:hypothetical protein